MKKTRSKLTLNKESLRNLDAVLGGVGTRPSIDVGCTSEYTWYCQTQSACSVCPICGVD